MDGRTLQVTGYGSDNIWVEDYVLYQAHYGGGMRAVDMSGELLGNLYTQGREIAAPSQPIRLAMCLIRRWYGAQCRQGARVLHGPDSGLWAVRIQPKERPIM